MGEESSGNSPPDSPLLVGRDGRRSRGATFTITEECERLFCETLATVFLGERKWTVQDSLVMGSRMIDTKSAAMISRGRGQSFDSAASVGSRVSDRSDPELHGSGIVMLGSSFASSEADGRDSAIVEHGRNAIVASYLQVWDYAGGAKFKGFTTLDKSMFIFFDEEVMGCELKSGLMALIELAATETIDCDRLFVCLERISEDGAEATIIRNLCWVGFAPATLAQWTEGYEMTSNRWILLGMDL